MDLRCFDCIEKKKLLVPPEAVPMLPYARQDCRFASVDNNSRAGFTIWSTCAIQVSMIFFQPVALEYQNAFFFVISFAVLIKSSNTHNC